MTDGDPVKLWVKSIRPRWKCPSRDLVRRIGAAMAHVEAPPEGNAALFARPSVWEELPGMQNPASTRVDVSATREMDPKEAWNRTLTKDTHPRRRRTQRKAYLRFCGRGYALATCSSAHQSPTRTLPAVAIDGKVLVTKEGMDPDAAADVILREMVQEDVAWDLDRKLKPELRAEAVAFAALAREALQEASFHFTWRREDSFRTFTRMAEGSTLPYPLNQILPRWARRQALAGAEEGQVESLELEIIARAESAYDALQVRLGTSKYLLGDIPCSADAIVFAHLLYHQRAPVCEPLHSALARRSKLGAYVDRIAEHCYGARAVAALPYAAMPCNTSTTAYHRQKETEKERIFKRNRNIWLACVGAAMAAYLLFGDVLDFVIDPDVDLEDDDDVDED